MDSFVWDQHFETGLADIDQQHRALVTLINHFGGLLRAPEAPTDEAFTRVIDELGAYAKYHFDEEEALMERVGVDPRHRSVQQSAHLEFRQEIARLRAEISSAPTTRAHYLFKFLIHWLAYHILGTDKAMARQIHAIGSGQDPAAAYADQARIPDAALEPMLHALNGLFHQVSRHNRELLDLNRTLEAKVAERTRELLAANQRLEYLAMTDLLTSLPNRRYAMGRLAEAWDESLRLGQPLSVMMIDADGFKQINDAYGHDAGDAVLRELSNALRDSMRNDDAVCRLGGDEFLILCPGTGLSGAIQAGEGLRETVAGMRVPAGDGVWCGSISVGVAERTADTGSFEALLKRADTAVYAAKGRGRNCVAW